MDIWQALGNIGSGIIGGIPGMIGSAASSVLGNFLNQGATDRQNSYNSPEEQMKRYQAAGLNPNLIYGQGTPGNQASATPQSAPDLNPQNYAAKAMALKQAQLDRQRTDVEIRGGEAGIARTAAEVKNLDTQSAKNVQDLRKTDAEVSFLHSQKLNADMEYMHRLMTNQMLEDRLPYSKRTAGAEFEQARYSADVQRQQVQNMMRENDMMRAKLINENLDSELKNQALKSGALDMRLKGYQIGEKDYDLGLKRNFGVGSSGDGLIGTLIRLGQNNGSRMRRVGFSPSSGLYVQPTDQPIKLR